MSISSIGIQTVTPSTGTKAGQQQPQAEQQQQTAANDNSTQVSAKSGSSSPQTTGQYVDKRV